MSADGFFGLGLALYFASQGAGTMLWRLLAGGLRLLVAAGGGWLALVLSGSSCGLFAALALGLVIYGLGMAVPIACGALNRRPAR